MERIDIELGIKEPWYIEKTRMVHSEDGTKTEMHVYVTYEAGIDFPCPVCGDELPEDDTADRTWLNTENYFPVVLHASVPLVDCGKDGCLEVDVPWTEEKYGFREI